MYVWTINIVAVFSFMQILGTDLFIFNEIDSLNPNKDPLKLTEFVPN